MSVNVSQAARLAGRSRNTIVRAIRDKKLKAPKDENGDYAIDEVELAKLFPPTGPSGAEVLEVEIEGLRALLEEVRASRDAWKAQAERLAAAMPTK
jgi:hypothetical protein